MVSLQMWHAKMVRLSSRLSHKQQSPWIGNVYRSATCQFSKSCGPVRYTPRSPKQPKNPSKREQDEHTKSYQHDVEETYKHVLPMPSLPHRFQDSAESLHLGCNLTKPDAHTKSGFSLDEENDFSSASAKTPHAFHSGGSSVNSAEVFEAYMNMQGMPINSLDVSQQSSPLLESVDSCTRSGFLYEEEENRATMYSRKHTAEGTNKEQGSSTDLAKLSISTKIQQTRDKEARSNAGSLCILKNGLDIAVEESQTKDKNPSAFVEPNVERKTSPQAVISNPSLPILGKHPMKRKPDFQEVKRLPCQDVESFLLKVQKAKQRGREPLNKSHAATSIEGSLCIDDLNNERDDSDDDRWLFIGQETLNEKKDVGLVSNSTAAQEHAKNQAIRYLAMRPYTAFQLRKKLESRNITSELIDYALATVQNCGLQSDLLFAETFSRARFNHGSWGPQRIKLGLQQRGISNEIIQVAIARVFSEEENESEQDGTCENDMRCNSPEVSRAAMDHLLVQATKQWNRGRNATNETKVRRMVSWLQYRGYSYSVIRRVLNHLQQKICIEDG